MRLNLFLAASALSLSMAVGACASSPEAPVVVQEQAEAPTAIPGLSAAAASTAVLGDDGLPVGVSAYTAPVDAVKAGDTAAFLLMTQALEPEERESNTLFDAFLAIDKAADGDTAGARQALGLDPEQGDLETVSGFYVFLDAWLLAMEGDAEAAIGRHRQASPDMPGLTGDLSLAAMLEALGRPEQALAVYEAMTPSNIEAPEHEFDPKGVLYSHVKTVISRHALLLQRLDRIDEAKAVYQRLADAEPEEAISYAAAMDSLETGKNLDNESLNVRAAFAQSLADVSRALQEQRIITTIMLGGRIEGFDDQRSAFDQVALLIYPEDAGLRSSVIDEMYEYALFEGVAHVALSAPKPTATLQIAAGQALIMSGEEEAARAAIRRALDLSDADEKLQTLYGALRLRTLMRDEDGAYELVDDVIALAENPAEKAAAYGLAGTIHGEFGDLEAAADYAGKARDLDDTHDRRMILADALGKVGRINEALVILRTERLARPNDPYTLNSLGYFLTLYTDKYDEAFRVLVRARAMAQNDPYIADSLGWVYYKLGHLSDAKRLIELSREELLPHRHWEIESHLGDIYWHEGDEEAAREAWQHALDNRPPAKEARKLTEKLADGLTEAVPEKQPLPDVSLSDGEVNRQEI